MINWLTTLARARETLNIDASNTNSDHLIQGFISDSSADIERYCSRKMRARTYGANGLDAERGSGQGTSVYLTEQYPIISVTSLYDDPTWTFDATTLKAAGDYFIDKKSGGIVLSPESTTGSIFTKGSQNIKLIYSAGFGEFEIITGMNDKLDFTEGAGALAATIASGVYTATTLATAIKTALDAAGAATFTVAYSFMTGKFTIASDGATFTAEWASGPNAATSIGYTIGFTLDDTAALTYTGDYGMLGIPSDIELACLELVMRRFMQSPAGRDRFDKKSEIISDSGTNSFLVGSIPPDVARVLKPYRKKSVHVY